MLPPLKPLCIVIVGPPCSGKTTLGHLLAERLNLSFFDAHLLLQNHRPGCPKWLIYLMTFFGIDLAISPVYSAIKRVRKGCAIGSLIPNPAMLNTMQSLAKKKGMDFVVLQINAPIEERHARGIKRLRCPRCHRTYTNDHTNCRKCQIPLSVRSTDLQILENREKYYNCLCEKTEQKNRSYGRWIDLDGSLPREIVLDNAVRALLKLAHPPLIFLVGAAGSGKITIGRALEEQLALLFLDGCLLLTDSESKKEQGKVHDKQDIERMTQLIIEALALPEAQYGVVLSTMLMERRQLEQVAQAGRARGLSPVALYLPASYQTRVARAKIRRECQMCRRCFDILEHLCPYCHIPLRDRVSDNIAQLSRREEAFMRGLAINRDFFQEKGQWLKVDGNRPTDEVIKETIKALWLWDRQKNRNGQR